MTIPSYLLSPCSGDVCRAADCAEAVKLNPESGRWFITMGHPGFNSRANNGDGYASRARALKAFRSYFAK